MSRNYFLKCPLKDCPVCGGPRFLENRPGRLIRVRGVVWKWRTGKGGGVIAYSELGDRRLGRAWKIKGLSHPDLFDRGQWKNTQQGMLRPGEVAAWLSNPTTI